MAAAGPGHRPDSPRTGRPGAVGEIGTMPQLIPLNIVARRPGPRRPQGIQAQARHRQVPDPGPRQHGRLRRSSPARSGPTAYLSLEFDGDIFLDKGGLSVHLEDLFSGQLRHLRDEPVRAPGGRRLLSWQQRVQGRRHLPHRPQRPRARGEPRLLLPGEGPPRQVRGLPRGKDPDQGLLPDAPNEESLIEEVTLLAPALPGRDRVPDRRRRRRRDAAGRAVPVPDPGVHAAEPQPAHPDPGQPPEEQPDLFQDHRAQAGPLPQGGGDAEPAADAEVHVHVAPGLGLRARPSSPARP